MCEQDIQMMSGIAAEFPSYGIVLWLCRTMSFFRRCTPKCLGMVSDSCNCFQMVLQTQINS